MRRKLLKPYCLKKLESVKDEIGAVYEKYADEGTEILIDIQPVSSKLIAEMYGLKVNKMLVGYTKERNVKEGDGICVEVEGTNEPDYKVIGVRKWNTHTVIDLEKRC